MNPSRKPETTLSAPFEDCITREASTDTIEVGQWYWVKSINKKWNKEKQDYDVTPFEWLGCVMHVGSNYLQLGGPAQGVSDDLEEYSDGSLDCRVHFDNFYEELRPEPSPEQYISARVAHFQRLASENLAAVQSLTARLGVSRQKMLPGAASSTAVAVLSGTVDIKAHELALIEAKDKTLPALFKDIETANKAMCTWLKASSLPMVALSKGMKASIKSIDDHIFNISLYAGLTEDVVRCSGGQPADFHEKLHVMQRMLFADEECLLGYRAGGLEFADIEQFDAWVSESANRDRMMPFPRCIVAVRVRRDVKDREWDGSIDSLHQHIHLKITDKFTFLYIRNGEQVYRMSCNLEFDELIFPDRSVFDPSVPMMAEIFCNRVRDIITLDDYESRTIHSSDAHHWHPFNPSSVYYDDILSSASDTIKKYNRIAVIIQGLFDRSDVLHPHPPVKTWIAEGFKLAVELVYDSSRALMYGDAPDIQAYLDKCNASMDADSVVIGQEIFWLKKEAEKESNRLDRDWRNKSSWRPKTFKPYGDEGPGYVAKMESWGKKSRVATFTWMRKRRSFQYDESPVLRRLAVPADQLFNVSAYTPGDFRQFFKDPRTRAQYMKWAGLLVAAEEYWAGNLVAQAQQPIKAKIPR